MLSDFVITALFAVVLGTACVSGASGDAAIKPWADLVDGLKNDPAAAKAREALIERSRSYVDLGIIKRVYKYEDVGKQRTWLDSRALRLEPEIQETFALAMADANACAVVSAELPTLAAAYRLTGDDAFKDRVIAQIEEMTTWSPLQRPGWTLYAPGHRLPPDGKDGNWLATGPGVRAIADTFEILPNGTISADLEERLRKLLASEIESIVDDWKTKRPWFVRGNNAITNQWVLPTEGLVRACLVLGKHRYAPAYELGVKNMLAALDSHGSAGEFEEGISYAQVTITSMLSAGRSMAAAGDRRVLDHPFLKRFPMWAVHHLQPGGMLINCFDSGSARQGGSGMLRPMLSLSAICTKNEQAAWGLDHVGPSSYDLPQLLASAMPRAAHPSDPPLYAAYDRARRVNWRDSWDNTASGVWIRGGHPLDQHDHQDRGHVNYIHRGKPILIEAGTPDYGSPDLKRCASCEGHNVLQIGDAQAKKSPAPIRISRLDAECGDVTVDAIACYEEAKNWTRRVIWSAESLEVRDEVVLQREKNDVLTFRWHLGTGEKVTINGGAEKYTVSWPDAVMTLEGSTPLEVLQQAEPQYTLQLTGPGKGPPANERTCILVRTKDRAGELSLTTRVLPRR